MVKGFGGNNGNLLYEIWKEKKYEGKYINSNHGPPPQAEETPG